MSAATFVIEN